MQRSLLMIGVAVALLFAWSIGRMQGQAEGEKVIFVSAKDAKFSVSPNGASGASMAPIWGDASMGAHGTFTKFVPGFDAGMHTHTNDVWLVVIKGAYLYNIWGSVDANCLGLAGRAFRGVDQYLVACD